MLCAGLFDLSQVWNFKRWKGLDRVTCWNGHSERVTGSDAAQFPPGLPRNGSVQVFVGELFRVATLNATDNVRFCVCLCARCAAFAATAARGMPRLNAFP